MLDRYICVHAVSAFLVGSSCEKCISQKKVDEKQNLLGGGARFKTPNHHVTCISKKAIGTTPPPSPLKHCKPPGPALSLKKKKKSFTSKQAQKPKVLASFPQSLDTGSKHGGAPPKKPTLRNERVQNRIRGREMLECERCIMTKVGSKEQKMDDGEGFKRDGE